VVLSLTAAREVVKLVLRAIGPAGTPGVNVGGEVSGAWWTEGVTGMHQSGCRPTESFTPLYTLKSIKPPGFFRRRSPIPGVPDYPVEYDT
jgi:hypothetical protein